MLIPRENQEDRLVIDLTPLNAISVIPLHKAPRLEDVLRRAASHKFFSKIDVKDAFWSLEITEDSKHLTAFDTPWGTFEFNALPQGWSGSPAHWQRYATHILRSHIYESCFVMADDIIVFGMTREECHVRTRQIRAALKNANLKENAAKTIVCATQVTYFGHTLTHGKWRPTSNTETLAKWKTPTNKRELQQWLGTLNVFRNNIPNLSTLIGPLTHLTGDTTWNWGTDQQHAFQRTKKAALNTMWREPHTPGTNQELTTDASDKGVGAILKEKGRVVAIISRKLTKHEQAYDTKHRECLAVVWATKVLAHIISDAPTITIHTDHLNLVKALGASEISPRVNRWIDWLQNFHIHWHYVKGINNPADGPSRQWDHA